MRALTTLTLAASLAALPFLVLTPDSAAADTRVDATYEISLAGWGIARATLDLALENGKYDASVYMQPKGVAKIVTAVRTSVAAGGVVGGSNLSPTNYSVRADEIAKPVRVDMRMRSGNVTSLHASPPLKKVSGRIPVTDAHKRNITDPLSSGLIPAKAADARDACNQTLKIYDGWTRYDVKLYYKGRQKVATEGYSGTGSVCGARWVPVAGHRPGKKEVQYLARNERLEMTVIPLPGTGYAIPYSVTIGTPNGEIKIEPSALSITGTGV